MRTDRREDGARSRGIVDIGQMENKEILTTRQEFLDEEVLDIATLDRSGSVLVILNRPQQTNCNTTRRKKTSDLKLEDGGGEVGALSGGNC
jgi:hypothetical protein